MYRHSRRGFLRSSALALSAAALARPTTLLAQATGAAAPIYDLVIKGGEVIDPSQGLRGRRDVAIRYAKVAALEPEIPNEQATYVLPADGKLVLPGLVDIHVHVFPEASALGLPPDELVPLTATTTYVSAGDADGYVKWLSQQTGRNYRLPSEAEFEYALRAGNTGRYPWGNAAVPPSRAGNFTGSRDRSPAGRTWANAFAGYGDGYWGPAPVGSFRANAFGLYDMAGNVSEWVADCWHDGYRRAPKDGKAWFNPGCRTRVIRGGSWASAPSQLRSVWRAPLERDVTNAQIGFRVVRDL